MRHASLAYLLILLLSSAVLDDLWAAGTVETGDDAQAAENNDYLRTAPPYLPKSPGAGDVPVPGVRAAPDACRPTGPGREVPVGEQPAALSGPPLLHLLSSLQC
jgi:hypothetical protein